MSGLGEVRELWLRSDGTLAQDLTAWLAMLVPVAMGAGAPLYLHGAVDSAALEGAERAMEVLHSWYPTKRNGWYPRAMRRVGVHPDEVLEAQTRAEGSVVLFSGGVDAFHTALRRESSHLLFLHGFDIPLSRTWLRESASRRLRAAAADMGRTLVEASTNVRELADEYADWGFQYHGAATAGIALAHAPLWSHAWIASGHAPEGRHPWASHPDLDPLWSSSRVTIEHDAPEWERTAKIAEIARWPVAMKHLRVCWQNFDDQYNCARCEKCVRTMLGLHLVGALTRCQTLPHDLNPQQLSSLRITGTDAKRDARATAAELLRQGEPELAHALMAGIRRGYMHRAYVRTRDALPAPIRAGVRKLKRARAG